MEAMIVIILIMLDQWTKGLAERLIGSGEPFTVIKGFFEISHLKNKGAAWSLFANQSWGLVLLSILSAVVLLALMYWLRKAEDPRVKTVLVLLAAGSAGNLIDRLRVGAVTDFLSFTFGSYAFPTFNLADALITVGAALLIIFSIMDKHFLNILLGEHGDATIAMKEDRHET